MLRAILLAALLSLAAAPVGAEEVPDAARRIAASLLRQLDAQKPLPKSVSVQPFKETGAARGTGLAVHLRGAIEAELKASGKIQVRDQEASQAVAKEKGLAQQQQTAVQALVVGDVLGGDSGAPLKASVRVLSSQSGATLADESATLGGSAPLAAQRPAAVAAGPSSVSAPAPRPRNATESASVDVAMRKIADQLMLGFNKGGNARYQRLAVLPFTETGAEARKRELGAVVTAELSTSLRRDHGALLVERQKLQQVMGEIKLGQSGAVDAASAPEIGKLADAQALVLGSVAEAGDRYLIDARIVSTETAETLAAASESVPAANLVALSSDAIVLRSKKDAIFRSLLIPGWGQIYNREPVKGYVFMGAIGASIGTGIAFHLIGASAEQAYKSANDAALCASAGLPATCTAEQKQAAADSLRTKAESRYTVRNVALGVAGSLWLLNVLDAYFSGVDGDKLLGGATAWVAPEPAGLSGGVAWAKKF